MILLLVFVVVVVFTVSIVVVAYLGCSDTIVCRFNRKKFRKEMKTMVPLDSQKIPEDPVFFRSNDNSDCSETKMSIIISNRVPVRRTDVLVVTKQSAFPTFKMTAYNAIVAMATQELLALRSDKSSIV